MGVVQLGLGRVEHVRRVDVPDAWDGEVAGNLFVGKPRPRGRRGRSPDLRRAFPGVGGVAPTYGYSCAATASITRAEYTSAAPALSATATPSASAISSRLAPCFSAASPCTVMQPSPRGVTATASAERQGH